MSTEAFEAQLARERERLFRLAYAMTGSRAQAEDLSQETLTRAVERGPGVEEAMGAWHTRVVVNLARDELRARKRRAYKGSWLPEPLPTPSPEDLLLHRTALHYALLCALETLSPTQRAVWLLREVCACSTRECAQALSITSAHVKTSLHRARAALKSLPDACPQPQAQAQLELLAKISAALTQGDVEALGELLREDVVMHTDSGGRYAAALRPVHGVEKLWRFLAARALTPRAMAGTQWIMAHGACVTRLDYAPTNPRHPPRALTLFGFDEAQRVAAVYVLVNPDKLASFFG